MKNNDRSEAILAYLNGRHFASIAELSELLFVSEATARREVERLKNLGAVKSVYGGVVIAEYEKAPVPIYLRDKENSSSKEKIAEEAARLVTDGSTVILDSSSTVRRMCKYLKDRKGLTVITNNMRVLEELRDSSVKVICTGGSYVGERDCFVGPFAEDMIRRIRADLLFFSSQGISASGDITDSSVEEVSIRRAMIASSKKSVFLCDSSKYNKEYPFLLCGIDEVSRSITDIVDLG